MYDLHTHSLLSDGALLPSEIAVRYLAQNFKVIAITDHADYSNIKKVVASILEFIRRWPANSAIRILPGVELTHLPLEQFKPLAKYARAKGIKIIVGHGQTPIEPVIEGTNRAALEAGIDILAHPGMISDEDAELAKKKGVFLEITCRRGHKEANSHVARQALKIGAKLIIDSDSHAPDDLPSRKLMIEAAKDAGLNSFQIEAIYKHEKEFLKGKGVK